MRQMLCLGNDFIDDKCDAQNGIIPGKTAILTIVDAFIGKIERCKQAHGPPKILQSEQAGSLRHAFEFRIGFGADQLFELLNKLRFLQSEIIQGFRKRHHANFAAHRRFATATAAMRQKKAAPRRVPDAAIAIMLAMLEGEVHAGADHPEVVLRAIDKIPTEITDPTDVRR
jgi:hypothetical protein